MMAMVDATHLQQNTFKGTRFRLTAIYVILAAILLALASFAAMEAEKRAFDRIQQALGNKTERPKLTTLLERSLSEFEERFQRRLVILDVSLLLITVLVSYILSGFTLNPIEKMIQDQEEFAADASHELRTPLSNIKMEIEAVERSEAVLPEALRNTLKSIDEEVSRMTKLVDSLLMSVRAEALLKSNYFQKLDFIKLTLDCKNYFNASAQDKGLRYQYQNLTRKREIIIKGSTDGLQQAVMALIDNAIKYTGRGGSVLITNTLDKRYVKAEVTDTGVGVNDPDKSKIFERYFRGTALNSFQGSGLGLSIAKKIVESFGGRITVESGRVPGSKFIISLPLYS